MSSRKTWQIVTAAVLAALIGIAGASAVQDGIASTRAENPRVAQTAPCKPLGGYFFGENLVRADIAVVVQGGPHLFRVDRGRVKTVAIDSLTLRERDGSVVTIPVAATATVRVNGRFATLSAVRRKHVVLTVRDGDNPASCVLASAK